MHLLNALHSQTLIAPLIAEVPRSGIESSSDDRSQRRGTNLRQDDAYFARQFSEMRSSDAMQYLPLSRTECANRSAVSADTLQPPMGHQRVPPLGDG